MRRVIHYEEWTDERSQTLAAEEARSHADDMNDPEAKRQMLEIARGYDSAPQRETRTIPIVFTGVGDPVTGGLVPRLNQPGGNITGFALYEASLGGKWLELLSEVAPGLKRAAIMFNPDTSPRVRAVLQGDDARAELSPKNH
jgi:ABC-type uncharacterized transport system substrate-binding protein